MNVVCLLGKILVTLFGLYLLTCAPNDEVINFSFFLCSAQLSMKFVLLINLKLLTIANSILLKIAEQGHFSANNYENVNYYQHFHINSRENK